GCVGCLVGHLFMFLVGGKTPDQSVHLNLTTTNARAMAQQRLARDFLHPLFPPLFCRLCQVSGAHNPACARNNDFSVNQTI
ncbi:hypothetical protein, partial [Klebsiella pneumoniae]|uniref:hypothetical protein n=1 Tax=Klebsiella pneumoniae TaxID=573 RepID=UPI001C6F9BF3